MLPTNQDWPPKHLRPVWADYAESAAWYSGNMEALGNIYAGGIFYPAFSGMPSNAQSARQMAEMIAQQVHAPAAADIASKSASFLFGEHPRCRALGADGADATQQGKDAQTFIDALIEATDLYSRFGNAADTCSGMGGVYLKADIDKGICDYPIINAVQPDCAVPEFSFGFLRAVTFYTEVRRDDDNNIYRMVQRHEPGQIENALYKGDALTLGNQVELPKDTPSLVRTGVKGLACVYIPNALPNRKHRELCFGRSDTAGLESMMCTLDTAWTAFADDIVFARGRIIAPMEYFEKQSDGSFQMDLFKRAYMPVESTETPGGTSDNITINQFALRAQEFIAAIDRTLRAIYAGAGYSPQSFGMDIQGAAESGTALRIRQSASLDTTAAKANYWANAIARMLFVAQEMHKEHFLGEITPTPITVEMQDGVPTDNTEVATCVNMLHSAQAASIDTIVRMVSPDKNEEWYEAEVKRIQDESGMTLPDVTGLP